MAAKQTSATADVAEAVYAKFERAKRTNAKCNAKELAIRDELQYIERRKVELATMRKMNRGQRNVWLENLTEETVIPYAKAWNLKFAEEMQATLPPEIRAMVNDYLVDEDMWNKYVHHFMAVTSVLDPEIGHCCCMHQFHGMPRLPHFLYPQYVGYETARELIEKVYSSNWFESMTVYGVATGLHSLLHTDPFGAGFDIGRFVRSVNIMCFVDLYRNPQSCTRRDISQDTCRSLHTPYSRRYLDRERIKSDFSNLLGLEKNKGFHSLEISFVQRNIRIDVLEEALEAFSEVYHAFRASGCALRVEWKYFSPMCGDLLHMHKRNMSKFFTDPRYTWKHRMLQFLKKMKMCIEPRHVHFVNEPSLGLSDKDFVHRMWDDGETNFLTDDEEDEEEDEDEEGDTDSEDDRDSMSD